MRQVKKILVPINFTNQSENALKYAVILAKQTAAEIVLMYVIENTGIIIKETENDTQLKSRITLAENKLDRLLSSFVRSSKVRASTYIKHGKVYRLIVDNSKILNVDLIVMGRGESSFRKKNITGTNAMHIIRESLIPVITISEFSENNLCDSILLPLDLTKPVEKKISLAIELSKIYYSKISVLSVIKSDLAKHKIKIRERMNEIQKIMEHEEIEYDIEFTEEKIGEIYQYVNSHAKDTDADMILLMTQREHGFRDYLIGNTAQDILNNALIPVLSVIPETEVHTSIPKLHFRILKNPL